MARTVGKGSDHRTVVDGIPVRKIRTPSRDLLDPRNSSISISEFVCRRAYWPEWFQFAGLLFADTIWHQPHLIVRKALDQRSRRNTYGGL